MDNSDMKQSIEALKSEIILFKSSADENAKQRSHFGAVLVMFNSILLVMILLKVW